MCPPSEWSHMQVHPMQNRSYCYFYEHNLVLAVPE